MRPPTVPAADAYQMRDDDLVLGVAVNGVARAYPWWILDDHHIANDVVGGRPVTIVLCEVCSSGLAFDPVVNGRLLTFTLRHVYNGTLTMDDHQTDSIWSPVLGTALAGPLKGAALSLMPLWQMEWAAWRELHPHSDVLVGELGSRTGHGSAETIGSPRVGGQMRASILHWDERLPHNTLVLLVRGGKASRAYPLSAFEGQGVMNDEVGGVPIVILHHAAEGSYGVVAYSRAPGGRVLTFRSGPRGPMDEETGSVWATDGRAAEGSLAGTQLTFVPSHVSEWYIVGTSYPGIEIHGLAWA
ncbi:MAG: DUF3179 domain-containing (seleno)protein [Actinomycetota bacterium]